MTDSDLHTRIVDSVMRQDTRNGAFAVADAAEEQDQSGSLGRLFNNGLSLGAGCLRVEPHCWNGMVGVACVLSCSTFIFFDDLFDMAERD